MEKQIQENKIIRGVKARACLPPSIPYPVVKSCVLAGPIQGRVWLHSHYLEQNCISNGALLCCIYKWSITDGNSSPWQIWLREEQMESPYTASHQADRRHTLPSFCSTCTVTISGIKGNRMDRTRQWTANEEVEEALKFYHSKEGPKHQGTKDNVCTWFSRGCICQQGEGHTIRMLLLLILRWGSTCLRPPLMYLIDDKWLLRVRKRSQ